MRTFLKRLFENPGGDLLGGLVAGIVALPLALAFGVASGLGAAAGLYGAIAVGIVAALAGGTPAQVSGPTGPMTVVTAGIVASFAGRPEAVFVAVLVAGAAQIAFGLLRLGSYVQYVPYPVVSGFMTGIGAIIVALQALPLFGRPGASNVLDALRRLPEAWSQPNLPALALGLAAIALVYVVPRLTRAIPASLVALTVPTAVAIAFGLDVPRIGPIPTGLPELRLPPLDTALWLGVVMPALTLAALGSIDSLLTSLVADRVTRTRHDSDRELVGQGLGNMLAGFVGGLPGAGATMRTVVNVRAGGRGPLSGTVHGLVLLAILLWFGRYAAEIPLTVLAGILVTVGIGIVDARGLAHLTRVPRPDAAILLVVLGLTVFVDLIQAVAAGMVMATFVFMKRMSDREVGAAVRPEVGGPYEDVEAPTYLAGDSLVMPLNGDVFFGNASALQTLTAELDGVRTVILDLGRTTYLDQSGAYALSDLVLDLGERGASVYLCDLQAQPALILRMTGIAPGEVPPERIQASVLECLRAARRE